MHHVIGAGATAVALRSGSIAGAGRHRGSYDAIKHLPV
jgi:hypothetical protein